MAVQARTPSGSPRRTSVFSPDRIDPGPAGTLIAASQRQRLLYGVTSTVAERGFAGATIEAITGQAGVSKKTFYEHFANKLECFLAAYDLGAQALLEAIVAGAAEAAAAGADAKGRLRAALRSGLVFLVSERQYARTFLVEVLPLGPEAIRHREQTDEAFIATIDDWHTQARAEHPEWPEVPAEAYRAAVAATYGLITAVVATERTPELPQLEDTLVYLHLALLQIPPDSHPG